MQYLLPLFGLLFVTSIFAVPVPIANEAGGKCGPTGCPTNAVPSATTQPATQQTVSNVADTSTQSTKTSPSSANSTALYNKQQEPTSTNYPQTGVQKATAGTSTAPPSSQTSTAPLSSYTNTGNYSSKEELEQNNKNVIPAAKNTLATENSNALPENTIVSKKCPSNYCLPPGDSITLQCDACVYELAPPSLPSCYDQLQSFLTGFSQNYASETQVDVQETWVTNLTGVTNNWINSYQDCNEDEQRIFLDAIAEIEEYISYFLALLQELESYTEVGACLSNLIYLQGLCQSC